MSQLYRDAPFDPIDLDRLCPAYDCAGQTSESDLCLGDDPSETLTENGGIARGAKLSIFDVLDDDGGLGVILAGNGVWAPALEAGAKVHSNSYGADTQCTVIPRDVLLDDFMYKVNRVS